MKLHGKINLDDALVVDERLLREVQTIILAFYESISYRCVLVNEDIIDFESIEELLEYDNCKSRRIKKLRISYGYMNDLVFDTTLSFFHSYKCTVEGEYQMEDMDQSILFSEKIKMALEKNKRPRWYTILTKISMVYFLVILFMISFAANIYCVLQGKTEEGTWNSLTINMGIIFGILFLYISRVFSKWRNTILPPVCFAIGEQVREIDKNDKLLEQIFWGVIVASGITIIFSLIL